MKRILAVLLSAMLVLSFAACSDKDSASKNEPVEEIATDAETDTEEVDEDIDDEEAEAEEETEDDENTVGDSEEEADAQSEEFTVSGTAIALNEADDQVIFTVETEDGQTIDLHLTEGIEDLGVTGIYLDEAYEFTYIENEDGEAVITKAKALSDGQ